MIVPALYAASGTEGIVCLEVPDGRSLPPRGPPTVPFVEAVSSLGRTETREPVVVADWDSIVSRSFDEKVMKGMRVRGRDIWFMTWAGNADDVMDGFNTTADMLLFPYHAVSGKEDLADMLAMSDSLIPVVFARNGKAVAPGITPKSVRDALEDLEKVGYFRWMVLDTDGSMSAYEWDQVRRRFPGCIPFSSSPVKGFDISVVPLRTASQEGTP